MQVTDAHLVQTASLVQWFSALIPAYPEIQAKAQKELDQVTGLARLPDFSDRDKLPYIDTILAEVLRWNPVSPFGRPSFCIDQVLFTILYESRQWC